MISWSSSVGEPWVAGSIPASTSARVAVEPQALPVTRRAKLPDVAGVGSEYRDPSPTPHGAQRGARHLPAIVNVAQSAERAPCKGQVARSTRAVGSGLCGCEFIEPYNSAELSASAEHHGGTPIRPWRIGTARNEERAKRLVTGRERPASLHGSSVEEPLSVPGFDSRPCAAQKQWGKGRVMPARRELITRGELGAYEGPPRAACPRGGRTPALGRSGSRPPRTSGVMRSVEVALSGDGAQGRDCRESAALFPRRCA